MQARYTLPRVSWGLDLEWMPNMLALVRETRKPTQHSPELPHLPVPPALKEAEAPESAVIDSACVGQCTFIGWLGFVVDGRETEETSGGSAWSSGGSACHIAAPVSGSSWSRPACRASLTLEELPSGTYYQRCCSNQRTTSPIQPPALPTQQHKEPMVLPLKK